MVPDYLSSLCFKNSKWYGTLQPSHPKWPCKCSSENSMFKSLFVPLTLKLCSR